MKKLILFFSMFAGLQVWGQGDTMRFKSPWELLDYAYQNTTFPIHGSNFLTDRSYEIPDSTIDSMFLADWYFNANEKKTLQTLQFMTWWDRTKNFKSDSLYFHYFNETQICDYVNPVNIPITVVDLKVNSLNGGFKNALNNDNLDPYPTITDADCSLRNLFYVGFFEDRIPTNRINLSIPEANLISNRERQVLYIRISFNSQQYDLYPGNTIELSGFSYGTTHFHFETHFDDGTTVNSSQDVTMYNPIGPKEKDVFAFDWGNYSIQYESRYNDNAGSSIDNPKIRYHIFYACSDKKIHKPFIVFTGFGPYMWQGGLEADLINWNQNWPRPYEQSLDQYNIGYQLSRLRADGFDIIFAQIAPPNASIELNSEVAIKVINNVNALKALDGCYEENIVMGYSAGALCARYALLKMEYRHLNNNGPHPHSKLFISNDGENRGANVPLGIQHTLAWLQQNENSLQLNTVALYYIVTAPLAKQLLAYYYTATGNESSPAQGQDQMRTDFLANQHSYNHIFNTHIEDYPSFQRNISISNGSSTPQYNSNGTVNHFPYPSEMGFVFLEQSGSVRRWQMSYVRPGQYEVFKYRRKPFLQPWVIEYAARTNNPRLLDNAPGGFFPHNEEANSDKFITKMINKAWDQEIYFNPDINEPRNFCFTPTMYTHDIRNYDIDANGGKLDYNFKFNLLNFTNEIMAAYGTDSSSNFYGYPHLGYPTNHYQVTPFDALFTFNQNTQHLINSRQISETFFVGEWTDMVSELPNFLQREAQGISCYLQNRRIGLFTLAGASYRADFSPRKELILGEHVTQQTDFVPVVFESNSISEAKAGKEIHFLPGVEIKSGAQVHFFIESDDCEMGKSYASDNEDESTAENATKNPTAFRENETLEFYPNPNNGAFTLNLDIAHQSHFWIYGLDGQLKDSGELTSKSISVVLPKGVYLITIQSNGQWYQGKLVIGW